jgi:hypothetical protein
MVGAALETSKSKDCRADLANLLIGRPAQDSTCATLADNTGRLVQQLIMQTGLRDLTVNGLVTSLVQENRGRHSKMTFMEVVLK